MQQRLTTPNITGQLCNNAYSLRSQGNFGEVTQRGEASLQDLRWQPSLPYVAVCRLPGEVLGHFLYIGFEARRQSFLRLPALQKMECLSLEYSSFTGVG